MTSTVLDVAVFLLCVSASVAAIGGAETPSTSAPPDPDPIADRIATETATVAYEAADGTRRHHATLAELLATAAVGNDAAAPFEEYRGTVKTTVADRLDPRTSLDVRETTHPTEERSPGSVVLRIGDEPPAGAAVRTAIVRVPAAAGRAASRADGDETTVRIVVRRW